MFVNVAEFPPVVERWEPELREWSRLPSAPRSHFTTVVADRLVPAA